MRRWPALIASLALAAALLGCTRSESTGATNVADLVLRVGEGVGVEVKTFEAASPPGLAESLAAGTGEETSLPRPPSSTLVGSGRIARPEGALEFFVMYQVHAPEPTVSQALRDLIDVNPWQVVGGQSNEGVTALTFQNTRNPGIQGTAVVQPLPSADRFEVVVERDGRDRHLSVRRFAFVPVLGAEFIERDGGLFVDRVVPGAASTAGLQAGDRVRRLGDREVRDEATLQQALRALSLGGEPVSSVIYIVRVNPDLPVRGTFSLPSERALPKDFPAPFLVLDGMTPIAVRWSGAAQSGTYEATLLTRSRPSEVLQAYRAVLQQQRLAIASDTAQGSATQLEFVRGDAALGGSITVDTFDADDSYTAVSLQVRTARPGTVPGAQNAVPTPSGSPAPASTATPTARP
ncbi:MAG: PDZ domain-containing protein [Dehalococcoidia bacterium]